MPAPSDAAQAAFAKLLEDLEGRVPESLRQQVKQTFSDIQQNAPDAVSLIGNGIMFRADADRVYSEARALKAQAEQERASLAQQQAEIQAYEQALQANAAQLTSAQYSAASAELESAKRRAEAAVARNAALENKLKEANVFDIFNEDLPEIPSASVITNNHQGDPTIMPAQPVQPVQPVQPASNNNNNNTSANPLQYVTPQQMQEMVTKASMDSFQAGLVGSLQVGQFAAELGTLTGKPVNPVDLSNAWLSSGKPLDQYMAETYNLQQLRTEAAAKAQNEYIQAEIAKGIAAERSKMVVAGTPVSNGGQPRSPVFQGFAAKQPLTTSTNGSPATTPNPSNLPASEGSQISGGQQPLQPTLQTRPNEQNVSNLPGSGNTVSRVAEALMSGKYSEEKFDLSRDLLRT